MFFNWKFEDVTAFKILQKHSGKIGNLIKKKNQYTVSFIGEAGKDNLGSFTQVCLNLFHYMCFKIYLANKSC